MDVLLHVTALEEGGAADARRRDAFILGGLACHTAVDAIFESIATVLVRWMERHPLLIALSCFDAVFSPSFVSGLAIGACSKRVRVARNN